MQETGPYNLSPVKQEEQKIVRKRKDTREWEEKTKKKKREVEKGKNKEEEERRWARKKIPWTKK